MGWGDTLGNAYNSASDKAKSATDKAANKAESAYNYAQDKKDQAEGIYKDAEQKKAEAEKAYADAKKRAEEAEAEYEKQKKRAEEAADAAKAAYEYAKNNPEAAAAQAAEQGAAAVEKATEQAEAAKQAFDAVSEECESCDYARDVANSAAQIFEEEDSGSIIDQAIGVAKSAFKAISNLFTPKKKGGAPVQPCPHRPPPSTPPPPRPATPPPPPPPPPADDINIVSVDWLNGDDATIIGACDQWVNLPRKAKWLTDSGIPNIDRLGIKPRFIVKFDRAKTAGFQWRIVKVAGGTPDYTGTEETRNSNFKASPSTWTMGSADATGKAIVADAAQLVAGGGYKFQIEAKDDKGKIVKSGIITTKRLFWYVEMPMTGLGSVLSSTAGFDSEFALHHITLKQLSDLPVPRQQNIGTDADTTTLENNVASAINGNATAKDRNPYLIRIAYTDHLAVKNPNQRQRKTGVQVGPGKPAVVIGVTAPGLNTPNAVEARSLWHNLVTGEGWLASAFYTPNGGVPFPIPLDKVTSPDAGDNKKTIKVDVTGLPAGTGTIDVYVNVVDRMRGGLAIGGAGNVCVCTISWWKTRSDAAQLRTLIHEVGHKVQMVAAGRNKEPDKVSTQYDNAGHVGSHCFEGCTAGQANYSTSANTAASRCVMFGSANGNTAFCANCAPAVKKVDIGAGF